MLAARHIHANMRMPLLRKHLHGHAGMGMQLGNHMGMGIGVGLGQSSQTAHHMGGSVRWLSQRRASFDLEADLQKFMHGRRNSERRDSVTTPILQERRRHLTRLGRVAVKKQTVAELAALGLGAKKRIHSIYAFDDSEAAYSSHNDTDEASAHPSRAVRTRRTRGAAGGFALHLTSASKDWPLFKHLLPEIVCAGHSNSGKSTLVNAMCGLLPSKGPASVSERAGWTDQICFYQLGKRPPVLNLVDLPGYGHAVASASQRRSWTEMIKDYLRGRKIISRCLVLVDCTRGLCRQDKTLISYLRNLGIPWSVVLTKGDLLPPRQLAQCVGLVKMDLAGFCNIDREVMGEIEVARRMLEPVPVGGLVGGGKKRGRGKASTDVNADVAGLAGVDGGGDGVAEREHGSEGDSSSDTDSNREGSEEKEEDGDDSSDDDSEDEEKREEEEEGEREEEDGEEEEEGEGKGEGDLGEVEGSTTRPQILSLSDDSIPLLVVSASTGAGVQDLWRKLRTFAETDSLEVSSTIAVREHWAARDLRFSTVALRAEQRVKELANPTRRGNSLGKRGPRGDGAFFLAKNRRSVRVRERELLKEDAEL
ncbi:P-loop containing nucleoside triphosphate hydrolase protein [Ochromonadaceae sp. CCMP2298]|nr:P-loop containing nucleoside triphosphate hydrolase protein [Ochromonadaceae sp. CCMP2298]